MTRAQARRKAKLGGTRASARVGSGSPGGMSQKASRRTKRGSPGDAAVVARLRAICLALPEANERASHGEPTWFAGKGKVFAMLDDHHHGAAHLSVWLPAGLGAQESLIESDPERYFRPPYVGGSGWVGVVIDTKPDWSVVSWLVEQAYRLVAHPRLVARLPVAGGARRTPRTPPLARPE